MNKHLSACGLNCPTCECFEATQSGSIESKQAVATKWKTAHNADLTAEDINCEGCMSDGAHFSWCDSCPIRACVVGKGYESCAECDSFPCETNQFIYDHVPVAKENIEAMRV